MCLVCKEGYEVRPQRSAAGWYMGTVDEEGCPNCRLTSEYSKEKEAAYHLRLDRQNAMENQYCNGCGNCGIHDKFNGGDK